MTSDSAREREFLGDHTCVRADSRSNCAPDRLLLRLSQEVPIMSLVRHSTIALALLIATSAVAQDGADHSTILRGSIEVENSTYPYRLLRPETQVEGKTYPLILFLHGAGERGDDNERQLAHFPSRMANDAYRERFPCFVLAPQCPTGERWVNADWAAETSTPLSTSPSPAMSGAIAALEQVVAEYPIDLDRIYLTGLSMGGYGTWDLAARQPGWFAAAAPICGGGDERTVARLAGLPISVWHGAADRVVPASRSRTMVEALRELDANIEYHELEGVGHNAWTKAYGENGCLDWMWGMKRDPNAEHVAASRLLAESIATDERIAFLGDSITQAGDRSGGYVDLLRSAISSTRPDSVVIPAGISGHRVPNLLARFHRDVIEKNATLVFIYIGINDVWHSQSGRGTPANEYEAGLRTLVRELRGSGATVVLATPSVIGERPFGDNTLDEMLGQYAKISRTVAHEEGATLCDLQRAFRDHLRIFNASGDVRGVLTNDGVHLNGAGNMFVATHAARALREAVLTRPKSLPSLDLSGLRLTPQQGWESRKPSSSMRAAEFSLGGENGEGDASLVMYYFGPGSAGSIEANLDRWCGQFSQPDGRNSKDVAKTNVRTINGMRVHTLDLGGTYVAETRPGSGNRLNEPNSHLLAAIVETEAGPYYLKLHGPAVTVEAWRESYDAMLRSLHPRPTGDAQDGVEHP